MDFTLDKKLDGFRQIAQEKLQSILCSIPDSQKDLVIDTCLIKPLEHICGASWLRSKGVNKIYKFDSKNPPQRKSTIVYFISANLISFKYILDQIHSIIGHQQMDISDMATKPFHVIVLPTVLHSFEVVLEEEGLFGYVEMHKFNWDFITIDTGALSLEMPQIFREVYVREDTSLLPSIAHSLRIFNMVCRHSPILITYGENSVKVANMIDQIEGFRSGAIAESEQKSDFSAMIIMDRNKDYATPLLTPVIYSGLLLELFPSVAGTLQIDEQQNRIQKGKLQFLQIKSKKEPNSKAKPKESMVTHLRLSDSVDGIYNENKYKHFSDAISMLSSQAKALGMESRNIQGMEISEMNEFVAKKLPLVATQKRELFKHLILCEHIVNELGATFEQMQTLEESMLYNRNKKQSFQKILEQLTTDAHRFNSLRSICLLYLTCGLTSDEATSFMTNYLNAYGYQYLPIFSHLSAAKLFPDIPNLAKTKILTNISLPKWQNAFQIEVNRMKLLPANTSNHAEQTNEASSSTASGRRDPVDASFVFNGSYIPLIAQLCNILCNAHKIDELAEKFGHTEQIVFHRCFQQSKLTIKEMMTGIKKGEIRDFFPLKPRTIFCFVIGGITYAELAAINFIEKMTGSKIVIGSDCITTGGDMIEAAFYST